MAHRPSMYINKQDITNMYYMKGNHVLNQVNQMESKRKSCLESSKLEIVSCLSRILE